MSCGGSGSVDVSNTTGTKYDCVLQKWCEGCFSWKWKKVYLKVYNNSEIAWFEDRSKTKAMGKVILKMVAQFLAVGPYTSRMPNKPKLPSGGKINYMIAFPDHPSRTATINWILLSSDKEIGMLMNAFCSVLPPPPKQRPPPKPHQAQPIAPPPYGSVQPPPSHHQHQPQPGPQGYTMNQIGGYPPQQGGYPQQHSGYPPPQGGYPQQGYPQQQVHPQQHRGYPQQHPGGYHGGRRRRGSADSGDGFATGMIMGAAIGMTMRPCWGWGYAPGWGYGGWGHYHSFDSHVHNSVEINNTYVTNETNNITNNYNSEPGDEGAGNGDMAERGGEGYAGEGYGGDEHMQDYGGYGQGQGYADDHGQYDGGGYDGGYDGGGYDGGYDGGYNGGYDGGGYDGGYDGGGYDGGFDDGGGWDDGGSFGGGSFGGGSF